LQVDKKNASFTKESPSDFFAKWRSNGYGKYSLTLKEKDYNLLVKVMISFRSLLDFQVQVNSLLTSHMKVKLKSLGIVTHASNSSFLGGSN
jgi:hypothetical protein